jgi:hypothetical protein
MRSRPRDAATLLLLAACGSRVPVGGATSSGTNGPGAGTSGAAESSAANSQTTDTSTSHQATGNDTTDADATGGNPAFCPSYLGSVDLGAGGECGQVAAPDPGKSCTTFNDTCPADRKCTTDGECAVIAPAPQGLYEACAEDELGHDNCDRGLRCYGGVCLMNCRCSPETPHCDVHGTSCFGTRCVPGCDPFHPSCPGDLFCGFTNLGFRCLLSPGPETAGTLGDPCEVDAECAGSPVPATMCFGSIPGSYPADRVPGCTDPYRCCMELCHFSDGNCSQPEAVCTPFYPEPELADCFGDIGGCMLPE